MDPAIGYYAYYLAKIGGFNLVSRELGVSRPYRSFYNQTYNGEVPGFELADTPLPGDICADGSHVGIVSSRNTTISATETGVVENDWGFRLKDKKKIRFFRYKGTKK